MPSMPQVFHVVVSLAHGGLERLVVDWTNARNRRHPGSTSILCLDDAGELASQVGNGCVIALGADRRRAPWDRAAIARLRTRLREGQPTGRRTSTSGCLSSPILHAHNLAAWQYAVLAAWGTGARTVYTQHGANIHNQRLVDRLRSRVLAFATDEIVAVSGPTALAMNRRLWVSRRRIRVVENGIDVSRVQPRDGVDQQNVRIDLGIPPDAFVLGSVGRLALIKGPDRLLGVLPAIIRQLPSAHLLLVGDGPERAALEAQAGALGVADRVRFTGFQADPAPYLRAMDVFVMPSRSEGLSMSLLEAMAAGVPAFVTDVGASRQVVEDGACGTVLPADEAQWPAIIGEAFVRREQRQALVARAQARVRTCYSMDATLDAYEQVYGRVAHLGSNA